jgi:hypothetical protein
MACGVAAVAIGLAAWGPRVIDAGATGGAGGSAGASVPILVELFTSEGCSSCPPADTLLTRLAAEKTIGGAEIVTLAFHVDYWDRLGWKDRFSSAAFTERQNRYAAAWKSDRVYTPQAVVDGRVEFVGTDVNRALEALAASAARPHARVAIALASDDEPRSKRAVRVDVEPPAGAAFTAEALLALAEDGLSTEVTAGENARKRLQHTGVVRSLTRIGRVAKGAAVHIESVQVPIDAAWASGALRAVVLVQDEKTREIYGTGQLALPAAGPADRVGFPTDYRGFAVLRAANITQQAGLGTIYGNAKAASIHDVARLPYPNGSVIVMEWATPRKAADGTLVTGANGLWEKGEVVRIDVMRREAGYGAAYGDRRAGEWEFASYKPDGSAIDPKLDAAACAACHRKPGTARDFVFRGRFPAVDAN